MVTWSTGSIVEHVGGLIGWSNLTNISGTTLNNVVVQAVNYANTYTNDNISTSSIAEKYQPSLIDISMADAMIALDSQEGGIDNVSLGQLSVSQGQGGQLEIAKQLKQDAINKLKELGRHVRYKKVYGA